MPWTFSKTPAFPGDADIEYHTLLVLFDTKAFEASLLKDPNSASNKHEH